MFGGSPGPGGGGEVRDWLGGRTLAGGGWPGRRPPASLRAWLKPGHHRPGVKVPVRRDATPESRTVVGKASEEEMPKVSIQAVMGLDPASGGGGEGTEEGQGEWKTVGGRRGG